MEFESARALFERIRYYSDESSTHLAIGLVAGNGGGLVADHEGGSFAALRRHVPSTSMLPVDAELPVLRWTGGMMAAPACVHVIID